MGKFCKDLKDQAVKIIDYEKKEIIPLTNEEKESITNFLFFIMLARNLTC